MAKFKGMKAYVSPLGHKEHRTGKQKTADKLAARVKVEQETQDLLTKLKRISENTPMDILEAVMLWLPKADLNEHDRAMAEQLLSAYAEWQEIQIKLPKMDDIIDTMAHMHSLMVPMPPPNVQTIPPTWVQPQIPVPYPGLVPSVWGQVTPVGSARVHASDIDWFKMKDILDDIKLRRKAHFYDSIMVLEPIIAILDLHPFDIGEYRRITPASYPNIVEGRAEGLRRKQLAKEMAAAVYGMSPTEAQMLDNFLHEVIIRGQ